ncbi:hypothetical protein ACWGHM_40765 [Streptomyces sp. NPDC054904]
MAESDSHPHTSAPFTLSANASEFTGDVEVRYLPQEDGYSVEFRYRITAPAAYAARSRSNLDFKAVTSDAVIVAWSTGSASNDGQWRDIGTIHTLKKDGPLPTRHVAEFTFDKPGADPRATAHQDI